MPEQKGGCPCEHVTPCGYACSCANGHMSGGCRRCCQHGSPEQQLAAAARLASLIDADALRAKVGEMKWCGRDNLLEPTERAYNDACEEVLKLIDEAKGG